MKEQSLHITHLRIQWAVNSMFGISKINSDLRNRLPFVCHSENRPNPNLKCSKKDLQPVEEQCMREHNN